MYIVANLQSYCTSIIQISYEFKLKNTIEICIHYIIKPQND